MRGSELSHLPSDIELGVRLHRSVDTFTDSHPLVLDLKQEFTGKLRRMSGVIIDIYFDYLLMTNWKEYSTSNSHILFAQFYDELETFSLPISSEFDKQAERLVKYRWLNQYSNRDTCFQAYSSIESRLGNKIQFAVHANHFIKQNHNLFARKFSQFYPELLEHGVNFVQSYSVPK
ncbi:MAG: ACP phosphodiesterase [Paraglaciecola sp.]|uniref:ACP phosphodiesterase n=1 Tax=Paraglaciecola sp. TaxID=1920173 RepID=UPI00326591EF